MCVYICIVFVLVPGTELLKPLQFPEWQGPEEHLLLLIISLWFQPGEKFMVMRWLLQSGGWVPKKQPRNFSPTPQPLGRVEGLGTTKLITNGLWFTQLGPCGGTIKPLNEVVQRASGLPNVSMSRKGDAPQPHRDRSSCTWDPCAPCLMYPFMWRFISILYNVLYNRLININKVFPWVLWAVVANYWKRKG